MKTKNLFIVVSAALLLAPDARAAHSDTNRRLEDTQDRVEEVQKLAHQVKDRARVVHRSAERLAHHGDSREERILVRLHELVEQAGHFHRQVERYRQNVGHLAGDFRELRRAYTRAAYAMHDLHAFGRIDREFDRLSDAMYDLEMYAEDLFGRGRPARRRYDDRDYGRHHRTYRSQRSQARGVVPRVRVVWNWFDD